jgi:hypothetical protein
MKEALCPLAKQITAQLHQQGNGNHDDAPEAAFTSTVPPPFPAFMKTRLETLNLLLPAIHEVTPGLANVGARQCSG